MDYRFSSAWRGKSWGDCTARTKLLARNDCWTRFGHWIGAPRGLLYWYIFVFYNIAALCLAQERTNEKKWEYQNAAIQTHDGGISLPWHWKIKRVGCWQLVLRVKCEAITSNYNRIRLYIQRMNMHARALPPEMSFFAIFFLFLFVSPQILDYSFRVLHRLFQMTFAL